MSLSSKSPPHILWQRKSQILRVKKAPLLPRVSNHQNGWWLCEAGKTSGLGTLWAPQAWPALGHVFMPHTKLPLKKGEGQSVDGAFSDAQKYFPVVSSDHLRVSFTRVFGQAWQCLGSHRWALPLSQCEHILSVTMATTLFPPFFFFFWLQPLIRAQMCIV